MKLWHYRKNNTDPSRGRSGGKRFWTGWSGMRIPGILSSLSFYTFFFSEFQPILLRILWRTLPFQTVFLLKTPVPYASFIFLSSDNSRVSPLSQFRFISAQQFFQKHLGQGFDSLFFRCLSILVRNARRAPDDIIIRYFSTKVKAKQEHFLSKGLIKQRLTL